MVVTAWCRTCWWHDKMNLEESYGDEEIVERALCQHGMESTNCKNPEIRIEHGFAREKKETVQKIS